MTTSQTAKDALDAAIFGWESVEAAQEFRFRKGVAMRKIREAAQRYIDAPNQGAYDLAWEDYKAAIAELKEVVNGR